MNDLVKQQRKQIQESVSQTERKEDLRHSNGSILSYHGCRRLKARLSGSTRHFSPTPSRKPTKIPRIRLEIVAMKEQIETVTSCSWPSSFATQLHCVVKLNACACLSFGTSSQMLAVASNDAAANKRPSRLHAAFRTVRLWIPGFTQSSLDWYTTSTERPNALAPPLLFSGTA